MTKDIRAFSISPALLKPSLIDKMSLFCQGFSVNILSREKKIVNPDEMGLNEKALCCL